MGRDQFLVFPLFFNPLSFFLSFFLSWVAKTQLNYWTRKPNERRVVLINHDLLRGPS